MYDRGGFIVSKQGGNTFLSATKAIIDHLTEWFKGSEKILSMSVIVNKQIYGLTEGICYSLPCICNGSGEFKIIENIELTEYQTKRIDECSNELQK